MEGIEHIPIARFFIFQGFLHYKIFGKFIFLRSFEEPKNRKKSYRSKLGFKQVIAVYIVENKTIVIFLELFKHGNCFLGHVVFTF